MHRALYNGMEEGHSAAINMETVGAGPQFHLSAFLRGQLESLLSCPSSAIDPRKRDHSPGRSVMLTFRYEAQ